jgi:hypothetical protein
MNTLLTERRHEQQQSVMPPLRRLTPMDRFALHLGVALIRWSRRPAGPSEPQYRRTMSHADAVRVRNAMERVRSHGHTQHDHLLMLPR